MRWVRESATPREVGRIREMRFSLVIILLMSRTSQRASSLDPIGGSSANSRCFWVSKRIPAPLTGKDYSAGSAHHVPSRYAPSGGSIGYRSPQSARDRPDQLPHLQLPLPSGVERTSPTLSPSVHSADQQLNQPDLSSVRLNAIFSVHCSLMTVSYSN